MDTTKLSSKGQVVLPKSVRDAHGWAEGTEFIVEAHASGVLLTPKKLFPAVPAGQSFARLQHHGEPKSLDEMNAGLRAAVRRRFKQA
jgi:AbrB family looped-hinge helix DNA binding protein